MLIFISKIIPHLFLAASAAVCYNVGARAGACAPNPSGPLSTGPGAFQRLFQRGVPVAPVVPRAADAFHALRLLSAVCLLAQAGGGFVLGSCPLTMLV